MLRTSTIVTVTMGAESYRHGKVYEFRNGEVIESGPEYAAG